MDFDIFYIILPCFVNLWPCIDIMGMWQIKIHIILGTKAQMIKMAPVMIELAKRGTGYNFILPVSTGRRWSNWCENFGVKEPM